MEENKDLIQVDIFGLSLSSTVSGGGYAIILKEVGGEKRLPIIIGQFEAQAIALELEGIKPPRPLTHDLLKNIIELLGYNVECVIIYELRDSTFFAKIKFDIPTIDDIDARPSDGIAIALKFGAPIYVASGIMEEIGFIPEYENNEDEKKEKFGGISNIDKQINGSNEPDTAENKLKQLKIDLDTAVSMEDYEKAAELRDEIKKLEISNLN
ncbi:MAG: bifunctional nuclease family protein [Ignavibacteriae bacterium]|nr:bifunctional nuclease family protein [Ignavibacteriota bacterium]